MDDAESIARLAGVATGPVEREILVEAVVDLIVEKAHQHIWHGTLTAAEARQAWLKLIGKLVQSVEIEAMQAVMRERLKV